MLKVVYLFLLILSVCRLAAILYLPFQFQKLKDDEGVSLMGYIVVDILILLGVTSLYTSLETFDIGRWSPLVIVILSYIYFFFMDGFLSSRNEKKRHGDF